MLRLILAAVIALFAVTEAHAAAGVLQFSAQVYTTTEANNVSITVRRIGGSLGAVSVTLSSSNGTAVTGLDYTPVMTLVGFGNGDMAPRTVVMQIRNDGIAELDETVNIALSNPKGGATLGLANGTISIQDNDPPHAPVVSASSTIKRLTMNWWSVGGATSYKLYRKSTAAGVWSQVGGNYPATTTSVTLDISVHDIDWVQTRYKVTACGVRLCADSAEVDTFDQMWPAIGYFKASNTDYWDDFGWSVALSSDGNTLAVGSDEDSDGLDEQNNSADGAGAVYIFTRDPVTSQWIQRAYLKADYADAYDDFGIALALSADGTTLAVGATGEDGGGRSVNAPQPDNTRDDAGAVYIFTRANNGQWGGPTAYIKGSAAFRWDRFGKAVALSSNGNTLAVGATGSFYVFTRANG